MRDKLGVQELYLAAINLEASNQFFCDTQGKAIVGVWITECISLHILYGVLDVRSID